MKNWPGRSLFLILALTLYICRPALAQNLDIIGSTLLQTVTTNVNGSGIRVAQPEAGLDTNVPAVIWQVNPAVVGQPASRFTYISSGGSASTFPNSLGSESGHADSVGGNFYGWGSGVATNVAHVDNYEANYFYNYVIAARSPSNINDPVVNQSFTFGGVSASEQESIDMNYDNYAAQYNTLLVSAAGNYGISASVCPPGTSYNCISVGAYQNGSSYNSLGPTIDNDRCKPDITAPGSETSFSTPYVSGAAAVLMQAGLRGDGGSNTNAAADIRTVKALLLNGAVKPADWTNVAPAPLDYRYGAGMLNVFNSYEQLAGGQQGYIVSTSVTTNSPHPPTGATGTVAGLSGWDFNTNSSSTTTDGVKHYYFNITNSAGNVPFIATATLVWNRQKGKTSINNLDLFLYDALSSNLVACSTSLVDNVQHLFTPQLSQGRYDLQVWKAGGSGIVSTAETYALAWAFVPPPVLAISAGDSPALTWPLYPAGFLVEAQTNLTANAWSTNGLPPGFITNGLNSVPLNATNDVQFFRLRSPDF